MQSVYWGSYIGFCSFLFCSIFTRIALFGILYLKVFKISVEGFIWIFYSLIIDLSVVIFTRFFLSTQNCVIFTKESTFIQNVASFVIYSVHIFFMFSKSFSILCLKRKCYILTKFTLKSVPGSLQCQRVYLVTLISRKVLMCEQNKIQTYPKN